MQVSLLELVVAALSDATVATLLVAGVLSLGLDLAYGDGPNDWVEGAAILAAVAVVVLVTAGNDFQKEKQFRELSSLAEYSEVSICYARAHGQCHVTLQRCSQVPLNNANSFCCMTIQLRRLRWLVQVTVVRKGSRQQVCSSDLVVGDVLEFGYGDILSVDGLLIEANDVRSAPCQHPASFHREQ